MTERKKRLVIIGAGGHAKVCYDIAKLMNKWNKIIILDDKPENDYFEIAGPIDESETYINDSDFFIAIGDNGIRENITNKLLNLNAFFATLIHPQAVIASDVEIGSGTVVMAGAVINSATKIGKGCIINTSSTIDHDNNLASYVHISPGSNLAGSVIIGTKSWIGIGAIILNNIEVSSNVIIGAGSVVTENIKEKGTYIGTPARMVLNE